MPRQSLGVLADSRIGQLLLLMESAGIGTGAVAPAKAEAANVWTRRRRENGDGMSREIISKADGECKRIDRFGSGRWGSGYIEPEVGSPADDLKKAVEIGRFGEVTIRV